MQALDTTISSWPLLAMWSILGAAKRYRKSPGSSEGGAINLFRRPSKFRQRKAQGEHTQNMERDEDEGRLLKESKVDKDWLTRVFGALVQRAPSDPSTIPAHKGLTHARTNATSRVTRARAHITHTTYKRTRRTSCVENGSYCYGYYLPLIRMGGRPECEGVGLWGFCVCACVRAFARICGGVYTGRGTTEREREREKESRLARATLSRSSKLNAPPLWTRQPDCRPRSVVVGTTPWPTRFSRYPAHDPQAPHFMRGQPTQPLVVTSAISIQRRGVTKLSYEGDGT